MFAGRSRESLDSFERCLTFGPLTFSAHLGCAIAHHQTGDPAAALRRTQAAIDAWPEQPESTSWKAFLLGLYGRHEEARHVVADLQGMAARVYVSPLLFAYAAIGRGDFDTAFDQLNLAFDAGDMRLIYLNDFPVPPRFRDDPRFSSFLRRCGLLFESPGLDTLTDTVLHSRLSL